MTKIYLAISKEDADQLVNTIRAYTPAADIELLSSRAAVMQALERPFLLLISTSTLINTDMIEGLQLKGRLIILDPSKKLKVNNEKVEICHNRNDVIMAMKSTPITSFLYKSSIDIKTPPKNKSENGEASKIDSISKQSNNIDTKEVKELNNDLQTNEVNIKKKTESDSDDKKINSNEDNLSKSDNQEDIFSPLTEKAIAIGKAMDLVNYKNKKTIGMWAPLTAGVTTFAVEFAIFLQKSFSVPIAVVELPKVNKHLLKILQRYGSTPENWMSLTENVYTSNEPNSLSLWLYKGVRWFPLGDKDLDFKRDTRFTRDFFLAVKRTDFVLVDLPTGEMINSTLDALPHLDELWVFIDDEFDRSKEWKEFIHRTLISEYKVAVKFIHSRTVPGISRPDEVAELFNLTLLTTLPAMFNKVAANKHEKKPLMDDYKIRKLLEPSFITLAQELIGEEFNTLFKLSVIEKIRRKLSHSIDGIKLKMLE